MLRRLRWLLLAAILALAGVVFLTFKSQQAQLKRDAREAAKPLPEHLSASFAEGWTWEKKAGDRTVVAVKAREFAQIKEPANFQLKGLKMRIYDKDGVKFDLVESESASFDTSAGTMFSDGEVEITMGLQDGVAGGDPEPVGRLVRIQSSGVTFDTRATRASTDRKATFALDAGDGEAVGAVYDATTRELLLKSEVKLNWLGAKQKSAPMHVETSELIYKEADSMILMSPWAKLQRGTLTLETANATLFLQHGIIERVEGSDARGSDQMEKRKIDYAAPWLVMFFTPKGEMRRIEGTRQAHLVSTDAAVVTTMTAERVDLDFDTSAAESSLQKALGSGKARVESHPVERAGVLPPDTRILASDVIEMRMRTGGKEIDQVVTHSAGTVEFLPNRPGQKKRRMDAERMTFVYGPENAIQYVRAVQVKTRTESENKGKPVATLTTSKDLETEFEPKTGQMTRLEQWGDFTYEEGLRRAKSDRAKLDQVKETILLTTGARMWDDTGSTSADTIEMQQKTGDMTAKGSVASTRLPDKKPTTNPNGMLSASDPMQARAPVMFASDNNRKIRYEGGAVLWQGASRINAEKVFIDRENGLLEADGKVVTNFPDSSQAGAKSNLFTVVRASHLVYSDKDKVAVYTGGVTMERPNLTVTSREMRAYFREEKSQTGTESKLDRLLAEGTVDVSQRSPDRTRKGQGERGDYYLDDEKMVLSGGNPVMVDSKRGSARGAILTWFARQDRLIVDNTGSGPAVSRTHRN
jgi:lipopolysaccharide export system protein LptA